VRVLVWHVHGSWMRSFAQGAHEYLVPVVADRGPYGRGRAETYPWPETVREVIPAQLRDEPIDLVVLQRPAELNLTRLWSGRRPGEDLPAVYVEHNTPRWDVAGWRHPLADFPGLTMVHVTHFNAAVWDSGSLPVRVIEHGIPDPGPLDEPRAEPHRGDDPGDARTRGGGHRSAGVGSPACRDRHLRRGGPAGSGHPPDARTGPRPGPGEGCPGTRPEPVRAGSLPP